MAKEKRTSVFDKEEELVKYTSEVTNKSDLDSNQLLEEYKNLSASFKTLLDEAMLITSVSDRLQNKLNRAHDTLQSQSEEINKINTELAYNNAKLTATIEELTKAKISRKAATYVIVFAMVLFIISEGILEPQIEKYTTNDAWVGLGIKFVIALTIKPIEIIVEKYLMRQTLHKD